MRYVTLLLSGVPLNVPLIQLSSSLDQLFDTNEIGTFELRDLPKLCGKRQIAIDFRSGFDAIEAQKRLDGYHYELSNGREYTLCAKITRKQEYLRTGSPADEPEGNWSAMALVPYVSDGTMVRANAKLDAQLHLLRKQKLILQTEREVLREKKKLKRDYSSKSVIDSDEEASPKRYRRSRSRYSSSSRDRSRSRSRRLRSKSREHKLLAIKSSPTEPRSKLRLRSRSKNRDSKSSKKRQSKSRESSSSRDRELKTSKKRQSKSRESSRSRDRELKTSKKRQSKSRESSRSRDRELKTSKKRQSKSRESSRSRDRELKTSKKRQSKSRESSRSRDRELKSSKKLRSKSRNTRSRSSDRDLRSSKKLRSKSRNTRSRSSDRDLRSSKKLRSKSRNTRSRSSDRDLRSSKKLRSKSRNTRSRSSDRDLRSSKKLRSKSRELRSRSRNREVGSSKKRPSKSRGTSRSRDRDLRSYKRLRSISRETRTPSRDRDLRSKLGKSRELRSRSRDRFISRYCSRDRSTSRDRDRSLSWDIDPIGRRSTSRELASRNRRSRSRDYTSSYYKMEAYNAKSPWEWDIIGRSREERSRRERKSRSRKRCSRWERGPSPQKPSSRPLAILPKSPIKPSSTSERKSGVPLVDYTDDDDVESSCYYKRSYNDETRNKKVTSSLESRRNCTITSDSTANKEERAPPIIDKKKKKIIINIDLVPKKTAEIDKNKTTESDKTKIGNSNVETNLNTNETVFGSVNEIENPLTDAKENTTEAKSKKKKHKKCKKLSKAETEKIRIASEDVMFLMETLVDEMSIKENITISITRRKILNDKLKLVIQDRIAPIATNENNTNLDILLRYRELYKKQDDVMLIKELFGGIPEDKDFFVDSSAGIAAQMEENIILKSQHYYAFQTENYGPDTVSNNTPQIVEIVEPELNEPKEPLLDSKEKIMEQVPITVINLTQDYYKSTKKMPVPDQLPKRPQFVLVIKRLLNQMKKSITKAGERTTDPFPTYQFKHVLRSILRDTVKGKGYMTTNEIVTHFRDRHPRAKDDEFVDYALEEIKTGKYGAYVIDVDDENDVLLIESKYDVVTVLDSDDEQKELMEKIDHLIEEKPVMNEIQITERKEAEATLQDQDKTSTDVIAEALQVETNNSELKEVTVDKEATANTEIAPNNELPSLPNLIEQYGVVDKEIVSNDVSDIVITEIKTELTDVAVESLLDSLKDIDVEAINKEVSNSNETLVETSNNETKTDQTHVAVDCLKDNDGVNNAKKLTTETEIHVTAIIVDKEIVSNDVSDNVKTEIKTELTDVAVESLLDSLKAIGGLYVEAINKEVSNTNETLVESSHNETKTDQTHVAVNSLKDIACSDNATITTETETPHVTAITIMTSYSELFSLKHDNKNTCMQVDEIKKEYDINVENNNDHDNEQTSLGNVNESINKDSETTAPATEDINNTVTIKNEPQEEEECIESISKYVELFCNDIVL